MKSLDPVKSFDGKWGAIASEPEHNRYGVQKVLVRTDGLFVVFDTSARGIVDMPIFETEGDARSWAHAHRGTSATEEEKDEDENLEVGHGAYARVTGSPRGALDLSRTCGACGCRAIDDEGICGRCGWRKP